MGFDKKNNEIWNNENGERVCSTSDCDKKSEKKGYCGRHYRQIQRHGRLTPELEINTDVPSECTVSGCNKPHYALGYCAKHHSQIKTHSKILDRTRFDDNEFIEYDEYYEMLLFDKNGNELCRTKISKCDYATIKKHKWSYGRSTQYVYSHIDNNKVSLHRFIMKPPKDKLVDHYNRNKLDNRRENLGIVDNYINSWNSLKNNNDETYIKGVNFEESKGKWRARLNCKHEKVLDILFENKIDAIISRLKTEKKYYGEYAPQRHLFEKYNI